MARFFRSFFSPSEQEGRVYDDKNRTGVMYKSAYNRIQDAGNCQDNCGKIQSFLLLKRPAGETLPGVFVCGGEGGGVRVYRGDDARFFLEESGVLGGCLVWRGVQRRRAAGGSGGCRRFCSGGAVVCGFIRVMACGFFGGAG